MSNDDQTYYHPVSRETLIKIAIEAMQELNLKVVALQARVEQLEHKARDDGK